MTSVVLDPPRAAKAASAEPAVDATNARRDGALATVCLGLALIAAGGALSGTRVAPLAALAAALLLPAALIVRRPLIPWQRVLFWLLLVILFIPIRRYKLPGGASFDLEPYRIVVAVILGGWLMALLVDRRVRLRASGMEGPMLAIVLATFSSIIFNPARVGEMQAEVIKTFTFFLSYVILFYFVVSVARTQSIIDTAIKTLVISGAILGLMAIVEARTGFTIFTRLHTFFPFLQADAAYSDAIGRGASTRAFGPAEHPIALGAALVMLVPLGIYLAKKDGPGWYPTLGALILGVIATVSRTGILMLVVMGIVYLCLRPRQAIRLWPVIIPLVVATQFAMPGTLGSLRESFFPSGGVVAQQKGLAGDCSSSGRVADLGPSFELIGKQPFLGYGFGTRITTGANTNACILDNQWLSTMLDVGIFGALAWLWVFVATVRRLGRRAKHDDSPTGWLLVGITASVTTYGVGMLTFDALGFIQVTLFLFIILGLGAAAARNAGWPIYAPAKGEFPKLRRPSPNG